MVNDGTLLSDSFLKLWDANFSHDVQWLLLELSTQSSKNRKFTKEQARWMGARKTGEIHQQNWG